MKKRKKKIVPIEEKSRYEILDVVHDNYVEFAIFDDDTEVARGSIKWDNCSNWEFHEMHFCELETMQEFHRTLQKCYEIASQKMKNWLTDETIRGW